MNRIRSEESQWNLKKKRWVGVIDKEKKKRKKKGEFRTERTYTFCVPMGPYLDFFKGRL